MPLSHATIPGADAWSAPGTGDRAEVGVAVVHGFTGNPVSTRPLGEQINDAGYTVEVPRLPGHGTSVRDLARTRYGDWRAEVQRVVDDLRGRTAEVVVVGLSVGGTLALDVACSTPGIAGVVTINTPILAREGLLARLAPLLQYVLPFVPPELADMARDDIARPGQTERAYGWVSTRAGNSLLRQLPRIRRELAELDLPVLIARSTQDHSVPPENSAALLELIGSADAELLDLENSYHVATLDLDRELLEDRILAFAERVTGR